MPELRKRYRVLFLAAIAAAVVVPVGYALSLESQPAPTYVRREAAATTTSAAVASRVLPPDTGQGDAAPLSSAVPGAAKLLLVGTTLFGLAAAVRRAI
jgi:hypothetical protein